MSSFPAPASVTSRFVAAAFLVTAALAAGCADCEDTQIKCGDTCIDFQTSNVHCGACNRACAATHRCVGGSCVRDCGDRSACGDACFDLESDARNCGECGRDCSLTVGERRNVTPTCARRVCQYTTCAAGFLSCDGNEANGCEADTRTSVMHCGGCGQVCQRPHTTPTCAEGVCSFTCEDGYADCDGDMSNGCEAHLLTSNLHCGGCNRFCDAADAGVGPSCSGGVCLLECTLQHGQCSVDGGMRCVNLNTDPENCGLCGNACPPGQMCRNRICTP